MHLQKILILLLSPCIFLYANIYNNYELNKQADKNYFFSTHFEKVIRFNPLHFDGASLDAESSQYIDKILNDVSKQNNEDIIISIIGHSHSGDNDILKSQDYIKSIQSYFTDAGVDNNITVLEARGSKDPLFNSNNSLSNRVMVTMYIKENQDKDKDGVLNIKDNCPDTEAGVKVSEDGCKIASIIMLMDNDKAENAIVVKTAEAELLLDEPNTFTSVQSGNKLSSVSKMSDEEMNSLFGSVIASSNAKHFKFTLYFEQTNLLESSKEKLNEIIDLLSKKDDYYIKIIGHTDTKGNAIYNQKLAQERVDVVVQNIKEHNLKYLNLVTEALGENQLAVPTKDNVNEVLNRRVELFIH